MLGGWAGWRKREGEEFPTHPGKLALSICFVERRGQSLFLSVCICSHTWFLQLVSRKGGWLSKRILLLIPPHRLNMPLKLLKRGSEAPKRPDNRSQNNSAWERERLQGKSVRCPTNTIALVSASRFPCKLRNAHHEKQKDKGKIVKYT